ncbi:MAG TPA: tetratricopeptide repeat protein [Steroidobacteraceae bacterium]
MTLFGKLLKRTATAAAPATLAAPESDPLDALYRQATRAAAARDFERAITLFDRAIALNPAHAESHYKRANALKDLGRLEASVASYDRAIEQRSDYAHAYCNRGVVQHRLGAITEALSSLEQAIAIEPADAIAHYNRALVLQDCSRWDEALASYDQSLAINPAYADAHYNRSLASLFLGDFENGWPGYEYRWKNAQRLGLGPPRDFEAPLWLGEASVAGKRLLLYGEGGLGDTLQFCRYAASAAGRGATVLLEVQAPLIGVLGNLAGLAELIERGGRLPAFDYQCPLMSLPLAFGTTLDTIPAAPNYLRADEATVAQWRALLGEHHRPRIGLVWSGNPNNAIDHRRSIPLGDWVAHLPPDFDYFCLQKDVRAADRAVLDSHPSILSLADDSLDFVNTAALCECMDVVISVDTSIAHLSAALGRRTWLLLPFIPDWRWMRDRDDSPWYPSMTLYRQQHAGRWHEVFARVAADLHRNFPPA